MKVEAKFSGSAGDETATFSVTPADASLGALAAAVLDLRSQCNGFLSAAIDKREWDLRGVFFFVRFLSRFFLTPPH